MSTSLRNSTWFGCWIGYGFSFAMSIGLVVGCTISDEDRCEGDFIWYSQYSVCGCPKGTNWTGRGNACKRDPVESIDEEDEDDSGQSEAGEESMRGLGESCREDADCASYDARICIPAPSGGYCSVECESPSDCARGYQCCDCSESTLVPSSMACVNDEDVSLAEEIGGCSCE